jgi:arginyl-tRNA synthetase
MFETEQRELQDSIQNICMQHDLPALSTSWATIPFHGEWGFSTSFFAMAAEEARRGKKVNVAQRAQEIALLLATQLVLPKAFDRMEAVRGYLNFYFNTGTYTSKVLQAISQQGDSFGRSESDGEKVMVEFSQPNTHKSFHVGHLRNVILGDAVCNLLAWAGNEVVRTNYIGDIGLHVIKWLWCYQHHHQDETPAEDKIRWLGDIYAEAARYYDDDPSVEPQVRALFARWHHGDPEIVALWEKTRQWSMEAFNDVYEMLGVRFDRIYFESEVEHSGIDMVNDLVASGLARDERPENSVIIPLDELLGTKEEYRVLVILRSDGTSLYSTKDLALALKKFTEFDLDRSIYVIDVRQSLYLRQIFKTLEVMGHKEMADKCQHLSYEIVNLPGNVTMASREGTVVLLEDLVREATDRAYLIVAEKNPELDEGVKQEIAKAVALGSIKYTMLSKDNNKIVTFDWERALDFNGQAAPYIQYAYVRAGSILRKADSQTFNIPAEIPQLQPSEIQLIELMTRIPATIQRAAKELLPMHLASMTYDLAKAFNDFYNQCPVLKADGMEREFRLALVSAVRQCMLNCLNVLGIIAPEAM